MNKDIRSVYCTQGRNGGTTPAYRPAGNGTPGTFHKERKNRVKSGFAKTFAPFTVNHMVHNNANSND